MHSRRVEREQFFFPYTSCRPPISGQNLASHIGIPVSFSPLSSEYLSSHYRYFCLSSFSCFLLRTPPLCPILELDSCLGAFILPPTVKSCAQPRVHGLSQPALCWCLTLRLPG